MPCGYPKKQFARDKSDRAILSMNQTNKEERSSAEPGEKRARPKENIVSSQHQPDTVGFSVPWIERCARSSTLANPPRWEPYAVVPLPVSWAMDFFNCSYASLSNPLHLCDLESFPSSGRALCGDAASDDGLGDPATAGSDAFWSTTHLSLP
jgi:hypothetical protein